MSSTARYLAWLTSPSTVAGSHRSCWPWTRRAGGMYSPDGRHPVSGATCRTSAAVGVLVDCTRSPAWRPPCVATDTTTMSLCGVDGPLSIATTFEVVAIGTGSGTETGVDGREASTAWYSRFGSPVRSVVCSSSIGLDLCASCVRCTCVLDATCAFRA
ncbi:uncharacterized protein B0H18DRAFT_1024181 [Fomitopsis serialis]|uniref:uncharacterized protein n=1 Tax=Fomitopsis serialis TaxID=139415 RepID=UPI002007810C|nr:uncharacterized protein B0H18DRAFT_1024181 [Neoantrodia serialis]KAH9920478.1 hypothetical protein B0H18DRAFT_1024181 [Neoantrodia serialis]